MEHIWVWLHMHVHVFVFLCTDLFFFPYIRASLCKPHARHGMPWNSAAETSRFVKRFEKSRVALRGAWRRKWQGVNLCRWLVMEVVQTNLPHKWTCGKRFFNVGSPLWMCLNHTAIRIDGLEKAWQRRHSGFSWVSVGQFLWVWHIQSTWAAQQAVKG